MYEADSICIILQASMNFLRAKKRLIHENRLRAIQIRQGKEGDRAMKSVRQALILEIIEAKDVETQEELAEELKRHGVNVTQATVSRDIKELRLVKVLSDKGGYKYATAERAEKGMNDRFIRIFAESVLSMVSAQNLIVIKTLTASAHAAAEAVDSLKWPEIVGTIAGDNTILVVLHDADEAENIIAKFNSLIRQGQ